METMATMATVNTNDDELPHDTSTSPHYAIVTVVPLAVIILIILFLVKFCFLRKLSRKSIDDARRIRTISDGIANNPPQYIDIPCTFTTLADGTIQICIPESPPYVKDPPPYTV